MGFAKAGLSGLVQFTLVDADEPLQVRYAPPDTVAWERANKGVSFPMNISASSLMWVGWRAARRQNLVTEAHFDQFLERVADFAIEKKSDDGEDPLQDPTTPPPPAG